MQEKMTHTKEQKSVDTCWRIAKKWYRETTHVFKSNDFISSIEVIFASEVPAGREEDPIHINTPILVKKEKKSNFCVILMVINAKDIVLLKRNKNNRRKEAFNN